ncbi:MAG: hypothetical protein PSV17_01585 [Methylotenera sp.]|uniref:hypothetical protein n=1 Tax=Methylotenera sp. TaxID=2051956 RepID=UPI00248769F0|nr:hypothetical protein [Methylotenera sp.]MDI1308111.1 hypothetical protein [Methylotenera sp.]
MMRLQYFLIAVISLLPQIAFSQIYKCVNSQNKIIYSEAPCSSSMKGGEVIVEPNVIDNSGLRRQITTQKITQKNVTTQNSNEVNSESIASRMSAYEKEIRFRELNIDMHNQQSAAERRWDAENEHRYLTNSRGNSLSYGDELKRRNLKVDLDSYDRSKRNEALHLLTEIYAKY